MIVQVLPEATVTVTPLEIEIGPAVIPFSDPKKVIFESMVFAFVRITWSSPKLGPPPSAVAITPDDRVVFDPTIPLIIFIPYLV